ncbi:P-loop NTPase fold protein [Lentzea sp. NPDC034063]|uniref:P-loop NTPase fold protein n=1 Tax=unclassified Lentzea TaxID=2643253 RepID=UPI0033D43EA4
MPVPDQPTGKDKLGFDKFVGPFAARIATTNRAGTPWTIGVYGEWGSGKTSFLMMIDEALTARGVRPIWFNAWKYVREENLWAALIERIITEAKLSVPWYRRPWARLRVWWRSIDFRAGAWELCRKTFVLLFRVGLLAVLILMAVSLVPVPSNPVANELAGLPVLSSPVGRVLVGLFAGLGSKPDALLKLFDIKLGADLTKFRRRQAHREQAALLDDFNREFRAVLDVVYGSKPLVVIIDDLDRCLPEQTLQIVETVKLVLDEPGCVFLLAVDREIIEQAIAVKYKDLHTGGRELGETYFEKVVQLPYSLPPAAETRVEEFIRSLSDDSDVHDCVPILRGSAPYNPRRIKRSVQAFSLLKEFADGVVPPVLAKLVVIQAQYRQVYRAVVDDHALLARLEEVYRTPAVLNVPDADLLLVEQVKRFSELYPTLKALLSLKISELDTFAGVDMERYVTFVKSVSTVDSPRPVVARTPAGVLLSYAPEDARWGEWVASQLTGFGVRVTVADPDATQFDGYSRMIALLSPAAVSGEQTQRSWAAAIAANLDFLPVMVEQTEVPASIADRHVTSMVDLDRGTARARLAGWLGAALTEEKGEGAFPGSGSVIANVPVARVAEVSRPALLKKIEDCFAAAPAGRPRICVLVGIGGAGKTTLARAYAEAHASTYEVTWFIRADAAAEDLAALAAALQVPKEQVMSQLSARGRWLLVFDGADNPDTLVGFFPGRGGGDVLITSRDLAWADYGRVVEVEEMSRDEAVALLGPGDPALLGDLANELGGLPLALSLAASYMRETGASVAEYRALLGERGTPLHPALDDVAGRVGEFDEITMDILKVLVLGGPDIGVDRQMVREAVAAESAAFDNAVAGLSKLALVSVRYGRIAMHPFVRRLVREQIHDTIGPSLIDRTLAAFRALQPTVDDGLPLADFALQARGVVEVAVREKANTRLGADLLADIGRRCLVDGDTDYSRGLVTEALRVHPDHLAAMSLLDAIEHRKPEIVVVSLGGSLLTDADNPEIGPMGVVHRYTANYRQFAHVECDGHVFRRNYLISGELRPDCVLLVVAASEGVTDEADAELMLAAQIGVRAVVTVLLGAPNDSVLTDLEELVEELAFEHSAVVGLKDSDDVSVRQHALVSGVPSLTDRSFVMPVDAVNVLTGGAPEVRGRLARGRVSVDDVIELGGFRTEPMEARISAIKLGQEPIPIAWAGDQVRLLLPALDSNKVLAGMVASAPGTAKAVQGVEAFMLTAPSSGETRFYLRGMSVHAKVVDVGQRSAPDGVAQVGFSLDVPMVLEVGDRFTTDDGRGVVTRLVE